MTETYKLYEDKILLNFDTAKHLYTVEDKPVYGVTNIVGVLGKPALIYWAVNQTVSNLKAILKPGVAYDEVQISRMLEDAKKQHRDTAGAAADIGTMIHDWVSQWVEAQIKGTPYPEAPINKEMKSATDGFISWVKEHKVKFLLTEQKIYSAQFGYAGTLDAEAEVDGKLAIIDFKTSSAIYPEYLLQASAYLQARKEETGKEYDGVYIVRLSKSNGVIPFEAKKAENIDELFIIFRACLAIYKWQMANKKAELLNK